MRIYKLIKVLLLVILMGTAFAQLSVVDTLSSSLRPDVLPIGAEDIVIYRLVVSSDAAGKWDELTLTVDGLTVDTDQFYVKVYQDKDDDSVLDADDGAYINNVAGDVYNANEIIIDVEQYFNASPSSAYFIVIDVKDTANITSVLNIKPTEFVDGDAAIATISSNVVARSFSLARLYSDIQTSTTMNYFVGDGELELFNVDLRLSGDTICFVTFDFDVNYANAGEGIGEIRIYRVFDGQLLVATELEALDNLIIGIPNDDNDSLVITTTKSFSIRYFYDDYANTGISFDIKINEIVGAEKANNAKGYPYYVLEDFETKNIEVSGIYPFVTTIFPADDNYIGGELPVFRIEAYSYFVDVTINTIELMATGDFGFSNTASGDVILQVLVYEDKGVVGTFEDDVDESILTVSVGDYDIIDVDTVRITVDKAVEDFHSSDTGVNLIITYVLTDNIIESQQLRTKVPNISYLYGTTLHLLDPLFEDDAYNNFETSQIGLVRMDGYYVTSDYDFIFPRGGMAHQIAYFDFSYEGVTTFDSQVYVDEFIFRNNSSLSVDGLEFYLIRDVNTNNIIEESDLPVIANERLIHYYDDVNKIITLDNIRIGLELNADSEAYFVMLTIPASANYGDSVIDLEIVEVNYFNRQVSEDTRSQVVATPTLEDETITISVSGLDMVYEKRGFSLPFRKQDSFIIATFSLISFEEFSTTVDFDIEIETDYEYALGTMNLIKTYSGDPQSNEHNILTSSVENNIYSFSDNYSDPAFEYLGITRDYVLYFYPDDTVDAGITFDVFIKNIQGKGYWTDYIIPCLSEFITVNLGLSGLKTTIDALVVEGMFIENMEVPVFKVEYMAMYDDVTFNAVQVVISNSSFLYTSKLVMDRVKIASIYTDDNDNSVWDQDDTMFVQYQMDNNELTELYLTINQLAVSGSSNTPLFILYTLATSGDIDDDTLVLSKVDTSYYTHAGDLVAIEAEENTMKTITLSPVSLIFTPGDDLLLSSNIEGAYDVPVISFKLRSVGSDIASYNIVLETNRDLYLNSDLGIKLVKLVEDTDKSNTFTSVDIVMDTITDFSDKGRKLTLNIQNVESRIVLGDPYGASYLILYELGQSMRDNLNIGDETIIRPQVYPENISGGIKTAGIMPYPRNERYMMFADNDIQVELLSLTPNNWVSGDLSISLRLSNAFTQDVIINSVYPQFYKDGIASLNVTYLYNIATTITYPFVISAASVVDVAYVISADQQFENSRLFLDALVEYQYNSQNIRMQRSNISGWERLITADKSFDVDLPENSIFYLDYPDYIDNIMRSASGLSFKNGDIIGNDDYLLITLKEVLTNLDTDRLMIVADGVTVDMQSSEPNYIYDAQNKVIRVGKFAKGIHELKCYLYDNAGNQYPVTELSFSVYDPNNFYIKDLLTYPSMKTRATFAATPMKIGFQLSKSCIVKLYLFNSRGEKVWTNSYTANLANDYYQLLDFDGVLDSGKLISEGMYILKAIIVDNGELGDAKITTKFIIK